MRKVSERTVIEEIDKTVVSIIAEIDEKGLPQDQSTLLHKAQVLDALKSVRDAAVPVNNRPRWPPVVIFFGTGLLLLYLLGKPDIAVIAVDVSTRALELTLSQAAVQQEYIPFSTSRIAVRSVVLEGSISAFPPDTPMTSSIGGAALTPEDWQQLVVEEIHVVARPGMDARMSVTAGDGGLRICTSNTELTLQMRGKRTDGAEMDVATHVNVTPIAAPATRRGRPSGGQACANFEIDNPAAVPLTTQLPVHDVAVSGPPVAPQGSDPRAILFPTELLAGKLFFPEVPTVQFDFRRDNRLGLAGTYGLLRRVDWKKDRLLLSFYGTAMSVTRSAGQVEQNLIPSRLSHLRAKWSDLILAWGLLLYLFGISLSVIKWVGGEK